MSKSPVSSCVFLFLFPNSLYPSMFRYFYFANLMNESETGIKWFHGKISGDNSTSILEKSSRKDGVFLVRESLSSRNSFVLCIWANFQAHQFRIFAVREGYFSIENGPSFHGLDSLIDHYRNNSDGLPCLLSFHIIGNIPPKEILKKTDNYLHQALKNKDYNCLPDVISNAPESILNEQNDCGYTPMHIAIMDGCLKIVELLLKRNIDLSIRDRKGCTPLHIACQRGLTFIVELLLSNGFANIQDRNSLTGWVSLHEAVFHGHSNVVKVLLDYGAPTRPRTPDTDIPHSLAERYNKTDILNILKEYESNSPPPTTNHSDWLHKNLTRDEANKLLDQHGLSDGLFLVRPNSKRAGYYALSLVENKIPYHFVIVSLADQWFYIDDGPIFSDLSSVISHYMKYSDGLPTKLKIPIVPIVISSIKGSLGQFDRTLFINKEISKCVTSQLDVKDYSHLSEWVNIQVNESSNFFRIDRKSIKLHREIGSGEFGAVYSGTYLNNEILTRIAIKTLREECVNNGSEAFLQEARVMFDLDHKFIVKLIGVCIAQPIMLIQELVEEGSLLDFIQLPLNRKYLTLDNLKLWAGEIACGMCFLESKRFVHRDLAARNILVASKEVVKISDFGLSRAVGSDSNYYKASKGGRWPVKWYAPESVYYGTFSHASDVWSYGITLWEMFSFGDQPYGDKGGQEVLQMLENGNRLHLPNVCPDSTYTIMRKCWNYDPKCRPTFGELYNTFSQNPEYSSVPHAELYVPNKRR